MADRTKSLEGASAPPAVHREGETSTTARPPPPRASSEKNGRWSSPTLGLQNALDEHSREIQSHTVANGNRSTEAVNNPPDLARELVAAKRRISQLTADVDSRIAQAAELEDHIHNLEQQIQDRNDQMLSLQRDNVQAKSQAQSSGERADALETDNARLQNSLELQQRHASEALGRPLDGHGHGKQPPSAHGNKANRTSAVPVVDVSQGTTRSASFNRTLPDYIDLTSLPFELHTKLPKVVFNDSPRHVASLNEATIAKARSLATDMLKRVYAEQTPDSEQHFHEQLYVQLSESYCVIDLDQRASSFLCLQDMCEYSATVHVHGRWTDHHTAAPSRNEKPDGRW